MKTIYSMITIFTLTISVPAFAEHEDSDDVSANVTVDTEVNTGVFGRAWRNIKGIFGAGESDEHYDSDHDKEHRKADKEKEKDRQEAAREWRKDREEHAREMDKAHAESEREHAKKERELAKKHDEKEREAAKKRAEETRKAYEN